MRSIKWRAGPHRASRERWLCVHAGKVRLAEHIQQLTSDTNKNVAMAARELWEAAGLAESLR